LWRNDVLKKYVGTISPYLRAMRSVMLLLTLAPPAAMFVPATGVARHSVARAGIESISLLQPSADDAEKLLLGALASSADSIAAFARGKLDGEEPDVLAVQKRESLRLRRSWDARLSWRSRKKAAAQCANGAIGNSEVQRDEPADPHLAGATQHAKVAATQAQRRQASQPVIGTANNPKPRRGRRARPVDGARGTWNEHSGEQHQPLNGMPLNAFIQPYSGSLDAATHETAQQAFKSCDVAGAVGTVAAVAGATVMQAAEMAAVAMIGNSPKPSLAANVTRASSGRRRGADRRTLHHLVTQESMLHQRANTVPLDAFIQPFSHGRHGATEQAGESADGAVTMLGKAATIVAATVIQAAEMATVAVIKTAGADKHRTNGRSADGVGENNRPIRPRQ
jgi:hypothetical protein